MCMTTGKSSGQSESRENNRKQRKNMLRRLTMLRKAIIRLVRRSYPFRRLYPEVVFECEKAFQRLRVQIQSHAQYWETSAFKRLVAEALQHLRQLIEAVIAGCAPHSGNGSTGSKKSGKGSRRRQSHQTMCRSIEEMLKRLEATVQAPASSTRVLEHAFQQALRAAFDKVDTDVQPAPVRTVVSQRGSKTVIFACSKSEGYGELITDKKRFKQEVVVNLGTLIPVNAHAAHCPCHTQYILKGFRKDSRKPMMLGGKQETFPIRLVKCSGCGQMFSLLPSFLAREKQYSVDLIGHSVRKLTLFGQSLAATLEDLTMSVPGGHSMQTLLDWVAWFGTRHPASILSGAGIQSSGYFQEDEGFEKEAGLRTYTVAMMEPNNLLVWHLDYVDHVDEETLCTSFEEFVKYLDVRVLGVTKDKWAPSTAALKRVCHGLWVAFCHRHELQKWRQAFTEYQETVRCSAAEHQRLYRLLKTVLDTAESAIILRLRLKGLEQKEAAFRHPILQVRLKGLRDNAVRYTCHHKRQGLTKTTSIVDNFLKMVKRKLRQVESFRDPDSTRLFFRAMATVRNFVPFLSGAKNAHQSPFQLANGQTHDLPWAQVMNVHNAFLFTAESC